MEYTVVYADLGAATTRTGGQVAHRVQEECNNKAREGWKLLSTTGDVFEGNTSGVWLYFERQSR